MIRKFLSPSQNTYKGFSMLKKQTKTETPPKKEDYLEYVK